jgi:hypothetical protein
MHMCTGCLEQVALYYSTQTAGPIIGKLEPKSGTNGGN